MILCLMGELRGTSDYFGEKLSRNIKIWMHHVAWVYEQMSNDSYWEVWISIYNEYFFFVKLAFEEMSTLCRQQY